MNELLKNYFVVLAQERQQRQVSPDEWWWYLDILVRVPAVPGRSEDFIAA